MKTKVNKLFWFVLLGVSAHVQAAAPASTFTATVQTSSATVPFVLPTIKNDAFWEGEQLNFVIKYEFIQAGTAVMKINAGSPIDNRPTFHIETKAESSGLVDKFFKVRDFNSAIVDRASMMSRNMHQNLKEGKYSVIRNTTFDYTRHKYIFERTRRGTLTKHEGPLERPVMDALGAFFYARTLDLHPGDQVSIAVFSDEKMYPLSIKVSTKVETIEVPAGKFECIMIEPLTEGDAIFKASDGKMQIWLTNDAYKMPVLIRSKVFIGSFDAELQSFERPHKPVF
jgi:hypothetical protein